MLNIVIKPLARKDLLGIWKYTYDTWGVRQADLYLRELESTINKLATEPNTGKEIAAIREGMRLIRHKQHIIIYQIKNNAVDIVRVLHKRMDIAVHL